MPMLKMTAYLSKENYAKWNTRKTKPHCFLKITLFSINFEVVFSMTWGQVSKLLNALEKKWCCLIFNSLEKFSFSIKLQTEITQIISNKKALWDLSLSICLSYERPRLQIALQGFHILLCCDADRVMEGVAIFQFLTFRQRVKIINKIKK